MQLSALRRYDTSLTTYVTDRFTAGSAAAVICCPGVCITAAMQAPRIPAFASAAQQTPQLLNDARHKGEGIDVTL